MKIIVHNLCCLTCLWCATVVHASVKAPAEEHYFHYALLTDIQTSQTFESEPPTLGSVVPNQEADYLQKQTAVSSKRSVLTFSSQPDWLDNSNIISLPSSFNISRFHDLSHLPKLVNVHFIISDQREDLDFGLAGLCARHGYPVAVSGCTDTFPGNPCPYSSDYVDKCLTPEEWCVANGYGKLAASCVKPEYVSEVCPKSDLYYKNCQTDNARACGEDGYSLNCDSGYVLDPSAACPYDSNYKTCVCNPCDGYDYTAEEANAQGYRPLGPVCNSCGVMKYMRQNADCGDYVECDCGGVGTACWSGTKKLFASCKSCYTACAEGQLDRNYYWCEGALKCFLPAIQ